MYTVPWSIENPVTTPDGLKDPEKAVAILVEAADEIDIAYGSMDVKRKCKSFQSGVD